MPDIQFKVDSQSLSVVNGLSIEANFAECKAMLTDMMQPYAGMVVTEDGISSAKSDRAKIRKVADRIDEARKIVKKTYQEPLAAFEAKCKELTCICNTASDNLDVQIKGYETALKEKKLASIREYFDQISGSVSEYITWEQIVNERWGNASAPMDKTMTEVKELVDTCADDLETIRRMGSPFEATLLDLYKQTRNLAACIRKNQELKLIQDQEEKRKAAAAEQSRQKEILAKMKADAMRGAMQRNDPETHERIINQRAEPSDEPKQIYELDFRVYATKQQLDALRLWLTERGIRFGRVPRECDGCGD